MILICVKSSIMILSIPIFTLSLRLNQGHESPDGIVPNSVIQYEQIFIFAIETVRPNPTHLTPSNYITANQNPPRVMLHKHVKDPSVLWHCISMDMWALMSSTPSTIVFLL